MVMVFFDWDKEVLTIPPQGQVMTDGIRTDLMDWENYEGEIPPSAGMLDCRLKLYHIPRVDDAENIIDLKVL